MTNGTPASAPEVGIFYLIGDKFLMDATPLARASNFRDIAFHELEHEQWWRQLVKSGTAPNTVYTEFPRGRVNFDRRKREFRLLADECILQQKRLLDVILKQMSLPVERTTISGDDDYRCAACEKRNG